MPRRSYLSAAAIALLGTLLAACGSTPHAAPTGPVAIPVFTQTPGSTAACRGIMRDLPTVLNHQKRRASSGSTFGAAWGNPAIVLRCGVSEPREFNAYATCLTALGVDWFLEGQVPAVGDAPNDSVLTITTVYRKPAIQVIVPNHYGTQGPSTSMAQLAELIRAHTTVSHRCV